MPSKIDIVKTLIEDFKRGDREAMRKSLADDLIWHANEPRSKNGYGGVMHGPDEFLKQAFSAHLHTDNVKSVTIRHDPWLTDEKIVMARQIEDMVWPDGRTKTFTFLLCFEFNDKNQIRRAWEVTNSDFSNFPFS